MSTLVQLAALACLAAGLIAGALTAVSTGRARLALQVALDFWLAAGLLRLGSSPGWESLLVAASVVAVRQLVGRALRRSPVDAGGLLPAIGRRWGAARRG